MEAVAKYDETKNKSHLTADPVINYIMKTFVTPKLLPAQEKLIAETMKHSWNIMLGSTDELQFLANLCKLIGAKKTLDIGVYTGYSALTIALALPPDGKVVACDISEEYANIGKPFWQEAGVENKIDLRIAPALETLNCLNETESGTYDFAFIDADKENYAKYYEACLQLLRPGGIIAVDNTIWSGKVVVDEFQDPETCGIRLLNQVVAADSRVDASLICIADGVVLAFKK